MVSSGILFVLGLSVCRKYFPSEVSAIPWAYHLSAHGHGSVRPNLMKVHAIFLPLQLPSSPHGSVNLEWKDQLGDDSKFWG